MKKEKPLVAEAVKVPAGVTVKITDFDSQEAVIKPTTYKG